MKRFASMLVAAAALAASSVLAAAPAAPVALVEEVSPAAAGVRALDFVRAGQVVELGPGGRLTLGYLESCVHERISGGRVTVGARESQVQGGKVERSQAKCDGGRLALAANQAVHSGAVAVRNVGPQSTPNVIVHDVSPLILLPKAGRVTVKRLDVQGERHGLQAEGEADGRARMDLAERDIRLAPGGVYMVTVGGFAQVFQVAQEASRGGVPLVGRLVPF
jgi:hypothetical protein